MPVNRATTLTAFRNAPALPDLSRAAAAPSVERLRETPAKLNFHIYGDLTAIESDWRRFERKADCTAFQTFDWLSAWHRNIGLRQGVHLAIIVGRYSDDEIAFIMPFCVEPRTAGTTVVLARTEAVRLQRTAAGARLLATRPARKLSRSLAGTEGADAMRSAAAL